MLNIGTAKLAGVTMVVGILAIAGTNLAFAQQPCVDNAAYVYIGCIPVDTAQWEGAAIVGGVVAFAIGTAAASGNLRH